VASGRRPAGSRLDYLTLLGVTLSVGAIVGGNMLEGGRLSALLQLTAFLIVAGGTLGAVLVQTPLKDFLLAMRRLRWMVAAPRFARESLLERVMGWSRIARRDGLLALEKQTDGEPDPFLRKGLTLLVDGVEPDEIRSIMEVEIDNRLATESRAARVFEAMGGYAPTIGILGAVLGLIHVMKNLSNPEALGTGIAVAFVATIYGVGFANLFFLPIANKLKAIYADQVQFQEMVVDGVVMIADGENPRAIQSKLEGYLDS
jgi:chemotaxis protein MotA